MKESTFDYSENFDIYRSICQLREELKKAIGKKIQLIMSCSISAESQPIVTGLLRCVGENIVKLELDYADEGSEEKSMGVYKLIDIIGFVPA